MCHRAHLTNSIKEKFKARIKKVTESIVDDNARNTRWITTFSQTLPDDIHALERHWGAHISMRATMQLSLLAFHDTALALAVAPAKSGHTMTRASLYEEKWCMATTETMTSARIAAASKVPDSGMPASPYFRLNIPWRVLAPHAGFLWWEATHNKPHHNLIFIRKAMLAALPPTCFFRCRHGGRYGL